MKKIKAGDLVEMTKNGRKCFSKLKSFTGVCLATREFFVEIKRDDIAHRGEKAGHWWNKDYWKKIS
jgi:hypothetical protein